MHNSDAMAIFPRGTAANMLEISPRTLDTYEKEGLIQPIRKGRWRYFSLDDINWICCLRKIIHDQSISIAAVKRHLDFTPCWMIADCSPEKQSRCTAFLASGFGYHG